MSVRPWTELESAPFDIKAMSQVLLEIGLAPHEADMTAALSYLGRQLLAHAEEASEAFSAIHDAWKEAKAPPA